MDGVESQIAAWRAYVAESPAVDGRDADELEVQLREQLAALHAAGLTPAEGFLVAVKRLGDTDARSRAFAREHSGRLWQELVGAGEDEPARPTGAWAEALAFAVAAGVAIHASRLGELIPGAGDTWVLRNLALFVVPFLAGYFARRRRLDARGWVFTALPFALVALVVNLYPFQAGATTEILVALHVPVVLWFAVAYPYMGGTLRSHERRMGFVRFTGEWVIYFTLIALGGGVLMALTAGILEPAGIDAEGIFEWVLPSGAAGAVIVVAWLVESKQRVVENIAPVLTTIFTPLFAVMLIIATGVYAFTGFGGAFDRELLGVFDALMVVVLGLVLYAMSAREPAQPPGLMDRVQLVAVGGALVLDVMVLGAMVARIGDLGLTPNRVAALGLNLVLLVNLAGAAWLTARFVTGRITGHPLQRWQTSYLPVFAGWAALVVVVVPPLFAFA